MKVFFRWSILKGRNSDISTKIGWHHELFVPYKDRIALFFIQFSSSLKKQKGKRMEFFKYGGQFVQGDVKKAVQEVEQAYFTIGKSEEFLFEFRRYLQMYANRPSNLYYAKNLSEKLGGAQIYLKREDLNHTGSHKINNCIGQALLAKRMGKTKLIAETGAGQHGVAVATVASLFGMEAEIHMGRVDAEKQNMNVFRMKLLGATVVIVEEGLKTLKEAVDSALTTWSQNLSDSFYLIGSAVGPHPYPTMVRDFQKVIGEEIKQQSYAEFKRLPDYIVACVGGGSNAIGAFYPFIEDSSVKLIGVEAAGKGLETSEHAATLTLGSDGYIHGMYTKVLLDEKNEISPVYSISAGLDYPGVGPEHAYLHLISRAKYVSCTDQEAIAAFSILSQTEGIIPAIESAHAVAHVLQLAPTLSKENIIVINLSGRGDKDVEMISNYL